MSNQSISPYSPEAYDYYYTRFPGSDDEVFERVVKPGIEEASEEFGLNFREYTTAEAAIPAHAGRAAYILASSVDFTLGEPGKNNGHSPQLKGTGRLRNLRGYLRELGWVHASDFQAPSPLRFNIVSSYRAKTGVEPLAILEHVRRHGSRPWGINIPRLDVRMGANTLYPDNLLDGRLLTNTPEDIADNIRCETFRLAFKDVRDNSAEAYADYLVSTREARHHIEAISKYFRDNKLWHRAPTDGAVFIKTSKGWLASHTQSDKTKLNRRTFNLIRDINPDTNTIVSTGGRPPSSDSPEMLVALMEADDDVRFGIHFHSNGITRVSSNREIERRKTAELIRYGRFSSAPALVTALKQAGDSWIVLKEHGVFWMGTDIEDFTDFIRLDLISNAHGVRKVALLNK